ncbi:MAG: thrombospondin type 3 repeat-containing protein [Myxococcales bacterium]|nr:thrombospondin type 3 repeat-containing protein [Myxococcales bacterium]
MGTAHGFLTSPRGTRWRIPILLAAAAAASAPAVAQAQNFNSHVHLDQMQPATPGSPFLQAEGPADRFDEGIAYGFGLVTDYAFAPLRAKVLPADEVEKVPVQHALLLHLGASLSPLDWLSLELNMPFAVYEGGEDVLDDAGNPLVLGQQLYAGEPGQGDLRIGAHFRPKVVDEVDLSFGARVWAPTGRREAYLRGPSPRARFELVTSVAGDQDMILYGCTLALSPLWFGAHDGDRIAVDCAVHAKLAPFVSVGLEPHFAVFTYPAYVFGDEAPSAFPGLGGDTDFAIQFEPLAMARFHVAGFTVGVGVGPGFGGAPGTGGARALLSLSYGDRGERPPEIVGVKDKDLDGVADDDDACPTEAGPAEKRGCPEQRDRDGDGIADLEDACPAEAGAPSDDAKANGCPDSDNDRTADPVDSCVREPGPAHTQGCPEHARLVKGDFKITPPIVFDKGRATLPAVAVAALKEVIGTMRANPELKMVAIAVGTKKAPPNLSDDRTKAILDLFAEQTFDANRYEVQYDDAREGGQVGVHVQR